jgi:hypothetical protein
MHQVNSDDVVAILDYFKNLEDPRSAINRKHLPGDLMVICIPAVIAGADGPQAIGVWAQSQALWLRERLQLPAGTTCWP